MPSELLLSILEMTQAALWATPSVDAAERLYRARSPLVAEARRFALQRGTGWTASEESLLRRIASLDTELLSRLRERHVASAIGSTLVP